LPPFGTFLDSQIQKNIQSFLNEKSGDFDYLLGVDLQVSSQDLYLVPIAPGCAQKTSLSKKSLNPHQSEDHLEIPEEPFYSEHDTTPLRPDSESSHSRNSRASPLSLTNLVEPAEVDTKRLLQLRGAMGFLAFTGDKPLSPPLQMPSDQTNASISNSKGASKFPHPLISPRFSENSTIVHSGHQNDQPIIAQMDKEQNFIGINPEGLKSPILRGRKEEKIFHKKENGKEKLSSTKQKKSKYPPQTNWMKSENFFIDRSSYSQISLDHDSHNDLFHDTSEEIRVKGRTNGLSKLELKKLSNFDRVIEEPNRTHAPRKVTPILSPKTSSLLNLDETKSDIARSKHSSSLIQSKKKKIGNVMQTSSTQILSRRKIHSALSPDGNAAGTIDISEIMIPTSESVE
jgi:hypothetical protein